MNRWYMRLAMKVARTSKHHHHRMGAVVFKGGAVLSTAPNAVSLLYGGVPSGKHAETRALQRHRDFRGATLAVVRTNARVSRPCADCLKKIKVAGISRVVYINVDGNLTEERL